MRQILEEIKEINKRLSRYLKYSISIFILVKTWQYDLLLKIYLLQNNIWNLANRNWTDKHFSFFNFNGEL